MNYTLLAKNYLIATSLFLLLGTVAARPALAQRMQTSKYEKGMMDKGQKVGVWEYYGYTASGEQLVVQRYDYDKHKLIYYRPGGYATYLTEVKPGEWKYVQPDQSPMFIGGEGVLASYMARVVYPQAAERSGLQGRVLVTFQIDTLGRPSNYRLTQRIGKECDDEALRVARELPQTWVPARIGSRAVVVEYELPFTFRLAKR